MKTKDINITDNIGVNQLSTRLNDAKIILITMVVITSIYLFLWQLVAPILGKTIPIWAIARFIEFLAIIFGVIILSFTSMTLDDTGIFVSRKDMKKTFIESIILCLVGLIVMSLIKFLLGVFNHPIAEGKPFWNWGVTSVAQYTYIIVVPIQEFASRGIFQSTMKKIFICEDKKKTTFISIIISTCLFTSLHSAYGSFYMLVAAIISVILGLLYERHGNIWGCVILHWFIGLTADYLQFI